jgi:hypothetical protein
MMLALPGKPEGKRPLGRPRHRWEVNIRMNLSKLGCSQWWALVNMVMNVWVP